MKRFNFIYVTTNLVTGHQYVGKHTSNNLNDNYLGSGSLIMLKIKEYGRKNFKREILEFFEEGENHLLLEKKYIDILNTKIPNGYNINSDGGTCGFFYDETSKKLSKISKGRVKSPEHIKKLSEARKGKPTWNKGKTNVYSDKAKEKMRAAKLNKLPWNKNKKLSDEHCKNLSKSHMGKNSFLNMPVGKCKYCQIEMKMSHLNRYHNENCKFK